MGEANNPVLMKMLERLFAGLLSGPSLNCRPHNSRQRIDFTQLRKLDDASPEQFLLQLLGEEREVRIAPQWSMSAAVKRPTRPAETMPDGQYGRADDRSPAGASSSDTTKEGRDEASLARQALLNKLRIVADEARTYEQDTGVHVLNIGFPILSLPPGAGMAKAAGRGGAGSRRVLAPLAFVPVTLSVRTRPKVVIEIACKGDEIDRVLPNAALLSWLDAQAGKRIGELFRDDRGLEPWREISEIVRRVAELVNLPVPALFSGNQPPALSEFRLESSPRAEEDGAGPLIVPAAVLGLFPINNQGLIRDMQAMVEGESLEGPVESFIHANVSLAEPVQLEFDPHGEGTAKTPRAFGEERSIAAADPCQSRAVRLARRCRGLVIHGPPGTGKSQTIINMIGDHLSRGERVLMVCDKRTALDVVANRLEHLGLGQLVALVHDPQRDQRDLYRSVREQLENLADTKTDARAEGQLVRYDKDLERLHQELEGAHKMLHGPGPDGRPSFHDLVGEWLSIELPDEIPIAPSAKLKADLLTWEQFTDLEDDLLDLFRKGETLRFADNPWSHAAHDDLDAFLARPMYEIRSLLSECRLAAAAADATADADIPPFEPTIPLTIQVSLREELLDRLSHATSTPDSTINVRWTKADVAARQRALRRLVELAPLEAEFRTGLLEAESSLAIAALSVSTRELAQQLGALESYLAVAGRWYGLVFLGRKRAADRVLLAYGLPTGKESAARLGKVLSGVRARRVLQALCDELEGTAPRSDSLDIDNATLIARLAAHHRALEVLQFVDERPALSALRALVSEALIDPSAADRLQTGLRGSAARAAAIQQLDERLIAIELFRRDWLTKVRQQLYQGKKAERALDALVERISSLEGVVRMLDDMKRLPAAVRVLVEKLLDIGRSAEDSVRGVRKAALAGEIEARLEAQPTLKRLDGERLEHTFDRYRQLDREKKAVVRDGILHRWTERQRQRLLASTGSRLNGQGADLRRRLTMRGDRALRLRQVIEVGQAIDGGDPLFDMRPVWMASPETVAQVLPRQTMFDVVIFDEASQCRLEEALPVLTRAQRVVIAGDPKQLPPTRFFESAVVASEDDEIETEQQLFEVHQGETEDLLGAALGIEIQQCYLDVHYRSTNADLIAFSNEQFYGSRLQPIPGHPRNRARYAPISLYRADGVYEDRTNPVEADQVCRIVRDLLRRAEPPSIGIACFNVNQRDLIVERLDELAADDAEFASPLAAARLRRGAGSFEGLFVKNLENVQGDERDHIIISTTYGPDPKGRFYRRFGPLGRSGGGRRLNVLVTRAREEVHLVTSIPAEVYRALPPIPSGHTPTGQWLLFSYLAYAERLAEVYRQIHSALDMIDKRRASEKGGGDSDVSASQPTAEVAVRASATPSLFAGALAHKLARSRQLGGVVHWGNEGFCIDVALCHPLYVEDVTLGLLCDMSRFSGADDPVEWDAFRTEIMQAVGWQLQRVWSPQFLRDPDGIEERIMSQVREFLAEEDAKGALRVIGGGEEPEGDGVSHEGNE